MIPIFLPSGDSSSGGGKEADGVVALGVCVFFGSFALIWFFSYWWLVLTLAGLWLTNKGIDWSTPLTDEQKRAYGRDLPPHLRSEE